MAEIIYSKSADGKQLVATEQTERRYDLEELQERKNMRLQEIATLQQEIDWIDTLLAECTKLGVVEKDG